MSDKPTYASDTQLSASGLSARRGGRTVFEDVEFSVQAGDFLRLTGRNGAGKSTLLRLLAGLLPSAGGTLRFQKGDAAFDHLVTDDFLLAGHQNGLKTVMTLADNARFFHRLMTGEVPTPEALTSAADAFALAPLMDQPVQYFSSGQRHRAALMRYGLVQRQVWLMDEPTVGLDADNRAALARLIADHLARGGIVIAATHDPIEVEGSALNMDGFAPQAVAADEAWL